MFYRVSLIVIVVALFAKTSAQDNEQRDVDTLAIIRARIQEEIAKGIEIGKAYSLGYRPIASSYHPRPIYTPQLIPAGEQWPINQAGYETFSQVGNSNNPSQNNPVSLDDRVGVDGENTQVQTNQPALPAFQPVPSNSETIPAKPAVKPPSFFPRPTFKPALVPPGQPWPASAEGYQNFSQTQTPLENKFKEEVTTKNPIQNNVPSETIPAKPPVKPPSFFPRPTSIPALVPPGQPWPANAEGYNNFSATVAPPKVPVIQSVPIITLDDRINVNQSRPETIPAKPAVPPSSFHPVPTKKPQLIPSGEPWPQSAEGYQNFSQIPDRNVVPLENRFNAADQNEPTRRPISTSTFPSLIHSEKKKTDNIPVNRAQQIIFPDDEMLKTVSSSGSKQGNEPKSPSSSHSKPKAPVNDLLNIKEHTTVEPKKLDGDVLHTSPNKITTPPPPGSLFTSRPYKSEKLEYNNKPSSVIKDVKKPHISGHNDLLLSNMNVAVANLLPDSQKVTDIGFSNDNLVGANMENGVYPPDNVLTSATVISHMQHHIPVNVRYEEKHYAPPKPSY